MRSRHRPPVRVRSVFLIALFAAGCAPASYTLDGPELDSIPVGKEDSAGVPGLSASVNDDSTRAWAVENQWEDRDTPAAQEAGLAWGANSGLDWDEKFAHWVGSLAEVTALADTGFGPDTLQLTTPFGKSLPSPKIDCADGAILLRASFAAWYHLPFYLVGSDKGTPVYFGHFGIRTAQGQWSKAPAFATAYADYSDMTPDQYQAAWPKDLGLRQIGIQAGDDLPFLGPSARLGAYLDEIHLNKRAARLILLMMNYLGSAHLADTRNTFNLVSSALRTGDVLLYRRGTGLPGHTMVVVRVSDVGNGQEETQIVFGNEPPAQLVWQAPDASRYLFIADEGGSSSQNAAGEIYSHLGGGLKRFRVAKVVGGVWMNTWMSADAASWINSTDYAHIGARPGEFASLLGEPTPTQQRDLLLSIIAQERAHLRQVPSSCAARSGREGAFAQLYSLMQDSFGMPASEVDHQYRALEDYVFAPLEADISRTCCWDSTTPAMYDIIMGYAQSLETAACVSPPTFKAQGGDYAAFAAYAQKIGRGSEWLTWRADEPCPQSTNLNDVDIGPEPMTAWCDIPPAPPPGP
jgi:hypothetical protein